MHARSLLALALAALLATPAAAAAQAAAPRSAAGSQLAVGGWLGYETGDLDGFQLRLDGELPFQRLSPQIDLSFVGSLGYSRLTKSASAFGFKAETTQDLFKIVPTARFTIPLNAQLSVFGDAGLGLYVSSISVETTDFGFGTVSVDDSAIGLMLRLGAGGFYAVNPKTKLGVQLVLDPMFGDHDDTTFAILGGLSFNL